MTSKVRNLKIKQQKIFKGKETTLREKSEHSTKGSEKTYINITNESSETIYTLDLGEPQS